MEHTSTFANRVKELREYFGDNQAEFGKRLDKAENTIWSWEAGKNTPHVSTMKSICNTTGANLEWLRTGEGEMFPKKETREMRDLPGRFSDYGDDKPEEVVINSVESLREAMNDANKTPSSSLSNITYKSLVFIEGYSTIENDENILTVKFLNDSMEPTIQKSYGICEVDMDNKDVVDNGIYLLEFPNIGMTIRRLQIKSNGILVVADNKSVEPELLAPDELEAGMIKGRVTWIRNKV